MLSWAWKFYATASGLEDVQYEWWTRWSFEYHASERTRTPSIDEIARTLVIAEKFTHLAEGEHETYPGTLGALWGVCLADAVRAQSHKPSALLMLDAYSGEQLAAVPFDETFRARFDEPYVAIHRVDLHNILLDACRKLPNVRLDQSIAVSSFEDLGDRVSVLTAEAGIIEGAALIGADGLRSVIRSQMHPQDQPRLLGYVAHRTIVPIKSVPDIVRCDEVVLWVGPAFHIIYYPLRNGTELNIVAVFKTDTYAQKNDPVAHKAELQKTYKDTHPEMQVVLGLMDLSRRWPLADRNPIRQWARGRVTLLGDSAHATLQSLAQGAGLAIEDAVYLAALLEVTGGDVITAFQRFQHDRVIRTSRVQLESRALWDIYHAEDAIARDVRRQQYQERTAEDYYRCLNWLWQPIAIPSREYQLQPIGERA
ncbi:FAD-dependent monooxygenase [Bradyrhizobium sp. 30]|uniref:FAD-dependent monooxygenase n=4 Tax=unclassified Bradyrhizobium TaxID=2631580 RepID=UPI001FF867BD|nr:FAD-dependent monooxygenase [Bradyrhizobium sp. 30]